MESAIVNLRGEAPEGAVTVDRARQRQLLSSPMARRTLLKGVAVTGMTLGLSALGVFKAARPALADGYDIKGSCPGYASGHNCSPGCGPSTVRSKSCNSNGWHRKDGSYYFLRPNECQSGTGWDGWKWKFDTGGKYCGTCHYLVTYRCHDGWSYYNKGWRKTICRKRLQCA